MYSYLGFTETLEVFKVKMLHNKYIFANKLLK